MGEQFITEDWHSDLSFYHSEPAKGNNTAELKDKKNIKRPESNVFRATLNTEWAMSTHSYCIVLPVCQTDNLQMSAPGLGGCRPEECPCNVQAAWEQRAASWPCLPLGFRSPGCIRDTLTDSLTCVLHIHTHWDTLRHTNTPVHAYRQMHPHICSCIIFTHLHVCTHACIKASIHDFPYVRTDMTEITIHANTVYTHIQTGETIPTLISTLLPDGPQIVGSSFFLSFLGHSGVVTKPTASHLPCCLNVTVTCSHYARGSQTYYSKVRIWFLFKFRGPEWLPITK